MADERHPAVDPRISARYRALGAEEPPQALDDAILAAGRRGASARPASLDRAQRRRWYAPLATAAVLVLAVAVTLLMQQEKPEIAAPVASHPAPAAPAPVPAPAEQDLKLRMDANVQAPAAEPRRKAAEAKPQPKDFVPEPPAAVPPPAASAAAPQPPASPVLRSDETRSAGALARQAEDRTARDAVAAARAPAYGPLEAQSQKRAESAAVAGNLASTAPGQELERIAQLRAEGKHEEADKALAEFRKRYPDYKIPDEMLRRVERR